MTRKKEIRIYFFCQEDCEKFKQATAKTGLKGGEYLRKKAYELINLADQEEIQNQ